MMTLRKGGQEVQLRTQIAGMAVHFLRPHLVLLEQRLPLMVDALSIAEQKAHKDAE